MKQFQQEIKLVGKARPIVIIGAGGILRDGHLPAYSQMGYDVAGVYDLKHEQARAIKAEFPIVRTVFESLEELIALARQTGAVFDVAVPAQAIPNILEQLPDNSAVLMQKPMGDDYEQAKQIRDICKRKNLKASVNFQLRYAPYILAAKDMLRQGLLGEIYDVEIMVCVYTPWHMWDFLFDMPRVEVLYHSIHYLDLVKSFLDMPQNIYARTIKHPKMQDLASVRSSIILDYGEFCQARVITNHGHDFGPEKQESYLKIEGTMGAIKIKIGLSMDYPKGRPPKMEYFFHGKTSKWQELPLRGGWFPQAFKGPMTRLQNHLNDKREPMETEVDKSLKTMWLVEKAYESSNLGGTKI